MLNKKSMLLILITFISILGTHIGDFALSLYLYEQSESVFMYSLFSFCIIFPELLFSPIFGLFVDKYNKKKLMLLGHAGAGIGSVMILVLLNIGYENLYVYLALVSFSSIFNSLLFASFNVVLAEEAGKDNIHILSSVLQIGFAFVIITSPALSAFLLDNFGIIKVFYIDVLTFSLALISISMMNFTHIKKEIDSKERPLGSFIKMLKEGFFYLKNDKLLYLSLVLLFFVNFSISTIAVLMTPLILSISDVSTFGLVMSIAGIGVLVGSLVMLPFKSKKYLYWMNRLVIPLALILFVVATNFNIILLSVGIFTFMFFSSMISVLNYTYWQNSVALELRGRLLGLRNSIMSFSIIIGYLASAPLSQYLMNFILKNNSFIHEFIGKQFHPEIRLLFLLNSIFLIGLVVYIEIKRRKYNTLKKTNNISKV